MYDYTKNPCLLKIFCKKIYDPPTYRRKSLVWAPSAYVETLSPELARHRRITALGYIFIRAFYPRLCNVELHMINVVSLVCFAERVGTATAENNRHLLAN